MLASNNGNVDATSLMERFMPSQPMQNNAGSNAVYSTPTVTATRTEDTTTAVEESKGDDDDDNGDIFL